jgi:carbon-monoxide dehydrogenase medium subunit
MYEFDYERPRDIGAALKAVDADSAFLAGGMTLLPTMKMRLARRSRLIDLGGLPELRGVRVAPDRIEIGAMTPHVEVQDSPDVRRLLPGLAQLAGGIGDPLVRNRGTIGGSIANSDPAADYPAAVLGLGATVVTNLREIPGGQFFKGMFTTALAPGELITRVSFPLPRRCAYLKFRNPASRYAVVGVLVAETSGGLRVAVTGAGPQVFRLPAFEQALAKRFAPEALLGLRVPSDGLNDDMHGSAAYRANLIGVIARRAVAMVATPG